MLDGSGSERKTDRAEAFSDAVLAIAITLPVLDLHLPEPSRGTLKDQFLELGPQFLAYAMSFVVIGVYWAYSHFSGKLWRKTDHFFNLLTLLFLGTVSITPFPARPFIDHLGDPANAATGAIVYAWVLTFPALVWLVRWFYGSTRGLLDPRLDHGFVRRTSIKYGLTTLCCLTGAIVATVAEWRVGIALVAAATLVYLLPPMAPTYKPGEEPGSDIEEADEPN
ncbi:DUF1211 domain-containing protein [Sphingomonas ginkgonis]|uniref:DUF1211 domain-containing protein n=1 Tax=Sphingomonas ginkgonis TaxID=2315330 RepID=A0A429V795_9SPHN|nr:TMEM175 family protein [Sphingomonas ginkgonis]RST29805.1 DUF1211 domain-containing protein [Sphingomonas ginkgonis]